MAEINCREYSREKKSYESRRSKRAVIFSCRYSTNSVCNFALMLSRRHSLE